MTQGYLSRLYSHSLAEFGEPIRLPVSQSSLLKRPILGTPFYDAMGCYPLFCCQDWSALPQDLGQLSTELISLTAVTDPLGAYTVADLEKCFNTRVLPFKRHWVVQGGKSPEAVASAHHRYYARKALQAVDVELTLHPKQYLDEWCQLYQNLCSRHHITGIQAFSPISFAQQLVIPGAIMFVARAQDQIVAAHIWYQQGTCVYSHLAAANELGYQLMAAYALHWQALDYFAERVECIHLGAGAGLAEDPQDGLTRFKKGWATDSRMAYLCGHVFDQERYQTLSRHNQTAYFPAYRQSS